MPKERTLEINARENSLWDSYESHSWPLNPITAKVVKDKVRIKVFYERTHSVSLELTPKALMEFIQLLHGVKDDLRDSLQ